ncbi:hypothetical protein KJ682_07340 [bacterium]|nr:hypothetical protein [bacterium]
MTSAEGRSDTWIPAVKAGRMYVVAVSRSDTSGKQDRWSTMGDKSPKSKERHSKQDATQKADMKQKKAADFAKAHPARPPLPAKGGKNK